MDKTTLDKCEIKCDYLVIETGYTSRLIDGFADPDKRAIDSTDVITVVCIKDELWGKKNSQAWASWTSDEDAVALMELLTSLELDGVIVLKLDGHNCRSKGSPFYACKCFHDEYGSGTGQRYCGFFDGIPEKVSVFEHEGLGTVGYMSFDTESG